MWKPMGTVFPSVSTGSPTVGTDPLLVGTLVVVVLALFRFVRMVAPVSHSLPVHFEHLNGSYALSWLALHM
jgi:hypothetical protein